LDRVPVARVRRNSQITPGTLVAGPVALQEQASVRSKVTAVTSTKKLR
jgi:hypothetical protein